MNRKTILRFLEENGCAISEEVEIAVDQLVEILEARRQDSDDIVEVLVWLEKKRKSCAVNATEIAVKELDEWRIDSKTGNIAHESGKFFSIIGVSVEGAMEREVSSWKQPMMKQEECGVLGILCQKTNGVMRYLLYAKYEPGSIAGLQLSPTLQATESNLNRAHGGKSPRFAEYFEHGGKGKTLVSVVEVEDPGRFYHKTNRCMIVEVPENVMVDAPDDYIWLTLPQIKKLLRVDNVVNALARCVLGSR